MTNLQFVSVLTAAVARRADRRLDAVTWVAAARRPARRPRRHRRDHADRPRSRRSRLRGARRPVPDRRGLRRAAVRLDRRGGVRLLRRTVRSTSRCCRPSASPRCSTSWSGTAPAACASCATRPTGSRRWPSGGRHGGGYRGLRDPHFLLGVDAPVSLLLVRQILVTIVVNTLLALPVYALVRRILPVPARRPAPPPPPRLHDRRAEPAEPGLSRMPPSEERRPADHAPARRPRRGARRDRLRAVRDRLLPPVVPAGALRRGVRLPGRARTGSARSRSRRRAATSSTATARRSCARGRARRPDRCRTTSPRPSARSPPSTSRSGPPPSASASPTASALRAFDRRLRADGRAHDEGRAARAAPPATGRPTARPACRRRRCPRRAAGAPALSPARQGRRHEAARRSTARSSSSSPTPYAAVTIRTDVGRGAFNYLLERQRGVPRRRRREDATSATTPTRSSAPSCSAPCGEISPEQLKKRRYRGVDAGHAVGKGGIEETYDR